MTILDYVIISETDKNKLRERILEYIKLGYEPYGTFSVTFTQYGQAFRFYQALIKTSKNAQELPSTLHINNC